MRFRGLLVPLILKICGPKSYDISKTIVVAGAPRAGTTWLTELVNTIPHSGIIFEPLHLNRVPEARDAGFKWENLKELDESWPEGSAFLNRVFNGEVRTYWTMSLVPVRRALAVRWWVVKFVRANMMLGWIGKTFPIKPPVLIIRHPCATIASYLRKAWYVPAEVPPLDHDFFKKFPEFLEDCKDLSTREELLALSWCMDYYAPLVLPFPRPFQLLSYEGLVRDGENELERIFRGWEMEVPHETFLKLTRPSMTTAKFSQVSSGRDPLTGWQSYLSSDQIKKILNLVEKFGMDFYSEEIEPDYDRLYGKKPIIF